MTNNAQAPRRRDPADPRGELGIAVDVTELHDVVVVTVHGAIDFWNVGPLQEKLHDARRGGVDRLVLDLSDVAFVDSTGLGLLISRHNELATAGGWLRLVNPQPTVRRVLRMTMLDERLALYPSVEAAIGEPGAG